MTFNTNKMLRVKSTHPSFRKMVLVDEGFLATQLEHLAPSSQVTSTAFRVSESPAQLAKPSVSENPTQLVKPMVDDQTIAAVEVVLPTTPLSTKPAAVNAAKRQVVKTRAVPRSVTPGHAPKVLRLY